jgi:ribosomal protein S4
MIDNNTNQPSNIDPKILKKQERKKMFAQLAKQREEQRQFKIAERQKLREQFIKYKGEINKLETKCKNDIEAK